MDPNEIIICSRRAYSHLTTSVESEWELLYGLRLAASQFASGPIPNSKSKLCYDWRSVGQLVLVSGTPLALTTKFSPSFFNYF
jgi:hypothetical protein